jgi:hypothetical protein
MLKKKLKWLMVPAVAAIVFVSVSSFTEESEEGGKECYIIENGHYGPVVFGVQSIVCDKTGSLACSIKVDCKTGKP